jgi:hypothetical protein
MSDIGVIGTFSSQTLPLYESSLRSPAETAFCVSVNVANISCSCAPLGVPEPPLSAASACLALDSCSLFFSVVRHLDPLGACASANTPQCCACLLGGESTKASHPVECREPFLAVSGGTC